MHFPESPKVTSQWRSLDIFLKKPKAILLGYSLTTVMETGCFLRFSGLDIFEVFTWHQEPHPTLPCTWLEELMKN